MATFWMARRWYVTREWRPWSERVPGLQRLLEQRYYFDQLYGALFVRSLDATAEVADRLLEEPVLDAAPVDVGLAAEAGAGALALTQTGYFRSYMLVFLGGAVVALGVVVVTRALS
jgi:NADH:ubiquinone oxidoreductase subunit 5 (subunit L)/multisubunit Na+/H+ antiporter MnhA subunit